ncbi:hypothetical protein VTO42DRAFT_1729 [Malbranchea cinnamomea]
MPPNAARQESDEQYEQRLKAALWANVRSLVHDQAADLQSSTTPRFVSGLLEVVWTQIESTSHDLEMFAKHAGRSTVNTSDIMLLTRRNSGLETILRTYVDGESNQKQQPLEDESDQDDGEETPVSGKQRSTKKRQRLEGNLRDGERTKRTST